MSARLTTIGKPPSIMKVELMKRRGIMPTWPVAMLAMRGTMRRKLVNITLRNMVRKNRLINRGRSVRCRDRSLCQAGGAKLAPADHRLRDGRVEDKFFGKGGRDFPFGWQPTM